MPAAVNAPAGAGTASAAPAPAAVNAPADSCSSGMATPRRLARRWITKRSCGSTSDSTDPGLRAGRQGPLNPNPMRKKPDT
jgi:hypothetical protein